MFGMQTVNRRLWRVVALLLAALLVSGVAVTAQGPKPQTPSTTLGTGFTYQGQLKQNGTPVNGTCDIAFRLYDASTIGNVIGTAMTPTVAITNGLFTTLLDFGAGAFNGDARWLDMQVRCPAGGGSFSALLPRQTLTPAPLALALPGLWTQQNPTSPNLIGGYSGNVIMPGVVGATIGGGGNGGGPNRILSGANYGTIGGGFSNTVSGGQNAMVGGGQYNTASGQFATVGGGQYNTASGAATVGGGDTNTASKAWATVGGGSNNIASGFLATVGGGDSNTASGNRATVGGGGGNTARGDRSFAAGSYANANQDGTFVWSDSQVNYFNSGGANQFDVRATGGISLVTGIDGFGNPTAANVSIAAGDISFGAQTRQMLNLWTQAYGIGVQAYTEYFRTDDTFDWFHQGVHSDSRDDAGAGGTRVMRLDGSGNLHVLGTVGSGGADVAELIVTSDAPQPADVVEIDPNHAGQFRLAASANSSAVAGVVSTHPGVRLNVTDDGTGDAGVQLALAGRVPVKVSAENGAIRPGDLLVASGTPGHAMRAPVNPAAGTIIGKALGSLDDGTGVIDMLVMLR